MSYRFYPERIESIGQITGVVGEDLLIPVSGIDGMRITIPRLSVSCGANDQILTLLQVKEADLITAIDITGKTVSLESFEEGLTDRLCALETLEGDWIFLKISASAAKVHTLDGDISPVKTQGRFLLFCEVDDTLNQRVPLKQSVETLIDDNAPGRLVARDFCYPVVIHITNTTTAVQFNGGSVVFICK